MANLRQLALPIIGGAGLFLMAVPAIAQQSDIVVTAKIKIPQGFEPVKKVVSLKGIDLSTSAGESEMEKRVGAAVSSICAAPPRPAHWEERDSKLCTETAWASARPQMKQALQKAREH